MELVAIIKVVIDVKRAEFMGLYQDHDEPFRTFATRIRSKAKTCKSVSANVGISIFNSTLNRYLINLSFTSI